MSFNLSQLTFRPWNIPQTHNLVLQVDLVTATDQYQNLASNFQKIEKRILDLNQFTRIIKQFIGFIKRYNNCNKIILEHRVQVLVQVNYDLRCCIEHLSKLTSKILFWHRYEDLIKLLKQALNSRKPWIICKVPQYSQLFEQIINFIGMSCLCKNYAESLEDYAKLLFLQQKVQHNWSKKLPKHAQKEQLSILPWKIQPVNALRIKKQIEKCRMKLQQECSSQFNEEMKIQLTKNDSGEHFVKAHEKYAISNPIKETEKTTSILQIQHQSNKAFLWERAQQNEISYDGDSCTFK